jgi:protein gp37
MSQSTSIEWTDSTWNPVRGCTKISPGCAHCYAATFAERFRGVKGSPYEQGFDLRLVPEKLDEPRKWKAPRRIFVNSMSDLFQVGVSDEYIQSTVKTMVEVDRHIYQVLTKRSQRMSDLLNGKLASHKDLKHIWWGVSVEDRRFGLPRIEHLQQAAPAVAFLSVEPLLEDLGEVNLSGIHWVIVGGESGPRSRPMQADWVRNIRDQCLQQNVPFFFKQWGGTRKHKTGRELDGRTWDEFPL